MHDGFLKDILELKMVGKSATGRKRWNRLSDLAKKGKYTNLKEDTGKGDSNWGQVKAAYLLLGRFL